MKRKTQYTRIETLLIDAAREFDRLTTPFRSDWLSEHEVTLDECGDLSEMIGMICRGYAKAPVEAQAALLVLGADDSEPKKGEK